MEEFYILDDQPTSSAEWFNFKVYADALSRVISNDNTKTPLVIGILGDWGSGKTSLMLTIKKNLEEIEPSSEESLKIKSVWFNAWEQNFEQGNILTGPSLLYHVYNELGGEKSGSEKVKEFGENILKASAKIAVNTAIRKYMGLTIDEVKNIFENETASRANLAESFQNAINDYVKKEYKRVVVFIDDLDRCLPENAVEILEVIKLFLNAEHCIFIIGVDRGVIAESIRVRYKDFYLDSQEYEFPITGDNYLEKIFQLSFQLPPIKSEDVEKYIDKGLKVPDFYKPYLKMITQGIDTNPRKIKRILNVIELQRNLAEAIIEIPDDPSKIEIIKKRVGAMMIEWLIINSYYPEFRNAVLKNNQILIRMHEYIKSESKIPSEELSPYLENEKLMKLIESYPLDEAPVLTDIDKVIFLTQIIGQRVDSSKIDSCTLRKIVINGKTYENDVIIYPGTEGVKDNWWRKEGHSLSLDDIKDDLVNKKPDVLIVGTGWNGFLKISDETKNFLTENEITLISKKTPDAAREYEQASKTEERVMAAFHLAC